MKTAVVILLIIVIVVWVQPLDLGRSEVVIPHGATARDIAQYLSEQAIVRNVDEFLLWVRITGTGTSLQSGTYELGHYKNPLYVIYMLTRGGVSEVAITIPEGLTIRETASILASHGLVDRDQFVALCTDKVFIQGLGLDLPSLEGYLFPDTYAFSTAQTDSSIIAMLLENFWKRVQGFTIEDPDSLHRIVILASLVEKEAKVDEERPLIARVFLNRLGSDRPLESCASVLYSLKENSDADEVKTKLTERDLKVESPYNTYTHYGLPPGPICSPGIRSITAAASPANVTYLYFVATGDGRHHFSTTYREHIAAKEKYNATR